MQPNLATLIYWFQTMSRNFKRSQNGSCLQTMIPRSRRISLTGRASIGIHSGVIGATDIVIEHQTGSATRLPRQEASVSLLILSQKQVYCALLVRPKPKVLQR